MSRPSRAWLVTGTDTGVGKTWASLALIEALQARGYRSAAIKPVATGCERGHDGRLVNDDARRLHAAASVALDPGEVNPYAFAPPIAPHLAAGDTGTAIDIDAIAATYDRVAPRVDALVVEGVGGWAVPLGAEIELGDIARHLDLAVILVVAVRLGCLNHALLSARQIAADRARLAGWIACHPEPGVERAEDNIAALAERLPAPLIARLPHAASPRGLGRQVDLTPLLSDQCPDSGH